MKLEIKKQTLKIIATFFLVSLFSFSTLNSVLANWDCNSSSAEWWSGVINTDAYKKATCIRDLTNCATGTTWGNECAVDCDNPAGCGACECRCQSGKLYCADKWTDATYGAIAQTCYDEGQSDLCVPTAEIVAPSNNSIFTVGDDIAFDGKATDDLVGEGFSHYEWAIRTHANNTNEVYTQDINRNTEDFNISSLGADSYYAFFRAQSDNGAWTTWMYISFIINPPTPSCTGPGPVPPAATMCPNANMDITEDKLWSNLGASACTGAKCEYYTPICGLANNVDAWIAPTENLCAPSSVLATVVSTTTGYNWTCGAASCSADKIIDGACGSAQGSYDYSATIFRTPLCETGNPAPANPGFPDQGDKATWSCNGIGGGATNAPCSACHKKECSVAARASTCIGKNYDDGCGDTSCTGTKDCRDLNWREVAPN